MQSSATGVIWKFATCMRLQSYSILIPLTFKLSRCDGFTVVHSAGANTNDNIPGVHFHHWLGLISIEYCYNFPLLVLQVEDCDVIEFTAKLFASGPMPLVLDDNFRDPLFDFDFSDMTDDGTAFMRGGYCYKRPYGWKRIALKVYGMYEDNIWLGEGIVAE